LNELKLKHLLHAVVLDCKCQIVASVASGFEGEIVFAIVFAHHAGVASARSNLVALEKLFLKSDVFVHVEQSRHAVGVLEFSPLGGGVCGVGEAEGGEHVLKGQTEVDLEPLAVGGAQRFLGALLHDLAELGGSLECIENGTLAVVAGDAEPPGRDAAVGGVDQDIDLRDVRIYAFEFVLVHSGECA